MILQSPVGGAQKNLKSRTVEYFHDLLKPEPLPKLVKGFHGTEQLVALRKRFYSYFPGRVTNKIRTSIFLAVFFTTFFYIAYLDYVQYISSAPVEFLSCDDKKWSTNGCGLEGIKCQPFESDEWYNARCPKRCYGRGDGIIGNNPYPGTNRICASAMHQGLIDFNHGGCFRYRFAGEQPNFTSGGTRNNIESQSGSWFLKSFELSGLENDWNIRSCNSIGVWIGIYPLIVLFFFVSFFLFEDDNLKSLNFLFIVVCGWLSLATREWSDEYWEYLSGFSDNLYPFEERNSPQSFFFRLNRFTLPVLFTLLPLCYLLYLYAGRASTFPDAVDFPLDCFLFYVLPFWAGVQLNVYAGLGLNTNLNVDFELKLSTILVILIFIPVFVSQCFVYYRSGDLKLGFVKFLVMTLAILIIAVSCREFVSIHVHHWFAGLLGYVFFQGQPNSRYSIIAQGIMLGVFVNGIVVYGYGEIFKGKPMKSLVSPQLFFTEVNISDTSFSLSWVAAHTVFSELECVFNKSTSCTSQTNQTAFIGLNETTKLSFLQPTLRNLETKTLGLNFTSSVHVYQIEVQDVILFHDILHPNEKGVYTYVQTGLQPNQVYSFWTTNTVNGDSSGKTLLLTEGIGNFSTYGGGEICKGIQEIYFPCSGLGFD